MKVLKIYKHDSKLTEFNFGKKNIYRGDRDILELDNQFKESCFSGWYKEFLYKDLKISHGKLTFVKPTQINFDCTVPAIEMIFILSGALKTKLLTHNQKQYFKSNTHNLFYYPNSQGVIEFTKKNIHFISIQITPSFFEKFIPSEKTFHSFKNLIHNQQPGTLKRHNLHITSAIQLILEEITATPWKGYYQKIFLYAKVLELLLLQLEQYRFTSSTPPTSLSDINTTKIYKAKRYIINHYNNQITIPKLAKLIGTNEFTLKKGFRELVGTTVFGYINDIKMHKAKNLLARGNNTIAQVSEMVGYKNPQHFSTAFKKKFGIVPSKFKT